ncbi:MAG TPA: sigma-70 family RNA polymerase sigma factor [Chthoniobacter sp.]|jgi:RNA polymerase sigma-70 factor (ECF subfamily)
MLYEFDHHHVASLNPSEVTDEQLMARVQARDEAALGSMYHRHTPILRTVISRVVHNESDVDDLLQEVFLEMWNRAQSYDETKGKVLGWLVTLARRRAIDRVRRRQAYARAEERLRLETEHEPHAARYHGVEDDVNAADRSEVFRRLLAALPPAQREALHLAYYRGLSQREIAAKTGIPLGTIKTRLELAVRKIRTAILSLGGAEEWAPAHN